MDHDWQHVEKQHPFTVVLEQYKISKCNNCSSFKLEIVSDKSRLISIWGTNVLYMYGNGPIIDILKSCGEVIMEDVIK